MATIPTRGDVWLVDLGMVANVRACLVCSIPADDEDDRVLATVISHTTSIGGSRFEITSDVGFLKAGAFDAQNIITIPVVKLVRRLGMLPRDQLIAVERAVKVWLGFDAPS